MSYSTLFANLSPDARCWFYAADRSLLEDEQTRVLKALDPFFAGWTSHQRPVRGQAAFIADRFLVIGAEIPNANISGCGIDKSVHAVEEVATALGFSWCSPLLVFWRDESGEVQHGKRSDFRKLVRSGMVSGETLVFDLSVETLGPLRDGAFEKPAAQSWHGLVFRLNALASQD